ncbi:hypothetical protein B0920_03160 [Massilia sp. KIM]|nr:hypothetical protein B0920_03160 [Massilia sp. KIM]
MPPLRVFIDTEFTSFENMQLISIALVSENGEETYFEVDFDDWRCSDFVRSNVIPLLGAYNNALINDAYLPAKILEWLQIVRKNEQYILICHDDVVDWRILERVLSGVPDWVKGENIYYSLSPLLLESFYEKHGLARHHALHDARANAYAYREQTNGTNASPC